jgi:hypothetical protein
MPRVSNHEASIVAAVEAVAMVVMMLVDLELRELDIFVG